MVQSNPTPSSLPSGALWLYGLPGSGVPYTQAAGAPPLAELERLAEGPGARVCICFGPLLKGLEELMERLPLAPPVEELEAALERWQMDLGLAASLKRRWREKVWLLNLAQEGPALETLLAREVPELAGRQLGGAMPADSSLELALRTLLQRQTKLLNAWLDAEHWADVAGGQEVDWRQPMDLGRWREALWPGERGEGRVVSEERCAELERELLREKEHGAMLQRYLVAMERELDHYAASHERAVALARELPQLLGRARRAVEGRRP
jgi:hypothetical protein